MFITSTCPTHDTVLFDGHCRFCRRQVTLIHWLDISRQLQFVSLHEPRVAKDFPEIPPEQLQQQMFVVDRHGWARGGAVAVRYLSRRLPLLWPLALLLHIPGTLPLWQAAYDFVAKRRLLLAGRCDDDGCPL